MSRNTVSVYKIESIGEMHKIMLLPKPLHPLVSIHRFETVPKVKPEEIVRFTTGFYSITIKKHCDCKTRYGQTFYDFDEGVMSFIAPDQVMIRDVEDTVPDEGWMLVFHPDFIRGYPLGQKIQEYGFFDYAVNEALILSEREEIMMENLFQSMEEEYNLPIDRFSQDVLVGQLDLMLTYSDRFYNRQFVTRKPVNNDLLTKFEKVLSQYFNQGNGSGSPSVTLLAAQLNLSPKYLSDTLKNLTGQSAQQHIQAKLIDKAKKLLTTTNLSVSEIAYELGFEYPQSFSKLFKSKVKVSPLDFRVAFQ
jgi:AraC family transcriptional regulator, transcriptional activator of pobA